MTVGGQSMTVRVVQAARGLDTPLVVTELASGARHEFSWARMPQDCRRLTPTEHQALTGRGVAVGAISDLRVGDILVDTDTSGAPDIVRVTDISTTRPAPDTLIGRAVLQRLDTGARYARSGTTLGARWHHTTLPDTSTVLESGAAASRFTVSEDLAPLSVADADVAVGGQALRVWKQLGARMFEPALLSRVPDPHRHPDIAAATARVSVEVASGIREAFLDGWFEASARLTAPVWTTIRTAISEDPHTIAIVRALGADAETLSRSAEFVGVVGQRLTALPEGDLSAVAVRDACRRYTRTPEEVLPRGVVREVAAEAIAVARRDWNHPFPDGAGLERWRDWAGEQLASDPLLSTLGGEPGAARRAHVLDEVVATIVSEAPDHLRELDIDLSAHDTAAWLRADLHQHIVPALTDHGFVADLFWQATSRGWRPGDGAVEIVFAAGAWWVTHGGGRPDCWGSDHRAALAAALHAVGHPDRIRPTDHAVHARVGAIRTALADRARPALISHDLLRAAAGGEVDRGDVAEVSEPAVSADAVAEVIAEIGDAEPLLLAHARELGLDIHRFLLDSVAHPLLTELRATAEHDENSASAGTAPAPPATSEPTPARDAHVRDQPGDLTPPEHTSSSPRPPEPARADHRNDSDSSAEPRPASTPSTAEQPTVDQEPAGRAAMAPPEPPAPTESAPPPPDSADGGVREPEPVAPPTPTLATTAGPEPQAGPAPEERGATVDALSAATARTSPVPGESGPIVAEPVGVSGFSGSVDGVAESSLPEGVFGHRAVWSGLVRPSVVLVPEDLPAARTIADIAIANQWHAEGRFLPDGSDGVIYALRSSGLVEGRLEDFTVRWRRRDEQWQPHTDSAHELSVAGLDGVAARLARGASRPRVSGAVLDRVVADVLAGDGLRRRGLDTYEVYCSRITGTVESRLDAVLDRLIVAEASAESDVAGVTRLRDNAWAWRELVTAIVDRAWIGHDFTEGELARIRCAVEDHTHSLYNPRMGLGEESAVRYTAETFVARQFPRGVSQRSWEAVAAHVARHRDEVLVSTPAQLKARTAARTAAGNLYRAEATDAVVAAQAQRAHELLDDADRVDPGSDLTAAIRRAALDHFAPEPTVGDGDVGELPVSAAVIVREAMRLGWSHHRLSDPRHASVSVLRYLDGSGQRWAVRLVYDLDHQGVYHNSLASQATHLGGRIPISMRPGGLDLEAARRALAHIAGAPIRTPARAPDPVVLSPDQRTLLGTLIGDPTVGYLAAALADPTAALAGLMAEQHFPAPDPDAHAHRPEWGTRVTVRAAGGVLRVRGTDGTELARLTGAELAGFAAHLPTRVRAKLDRHGDPRTLRRIIVDDVLDYQSLTHPLDDPDDPADPDGLDGLDGLDEPRLAVVEPPAPRSTPAEPDHVPTVTEPGPGPVEKAEPAAGAGETAVSDPAPPTRGEQIVWIGDEFGVLRAASRALLRTVPGDRTRVEILAPDDHRPIGQVSVELVGDLVASAGLLSADPETTTLRCTAAGRARLAALHEQRGEPRIGDSVLDLRTGTSGIVCQHFEVDDTTSWVEIVSTTQDPGSRVHTVDTADLALIQASALSLADARALYDRVIPRPEPDRPATDPAGSPATGSPAPSVTRPVASTVPVEIDAAPDSVTDAVSDSPPDLEHTHVRPRSAPFSTVLGLIAPFERLEVFQGAFDGADNITAGGWMYLVRSPRTDGQRWRVHTARAHVGANLPRWTERALRGDDRPWRREAVSLLGSVDTPEQIMGLIRADLVRKAHDEAAALHRPDALERAHRDIDALLTGLRSKLGDEAAGPGVETVEAAIATVTDRTYTRIGRDEFWTALRSRTPEVDTWDLLRALDTLDDATLAARADRPDENTTTPANPAISAPTASENPRFPARAEGRDVEDTQVFAAPPLTEAVDVAEAAGTSPALSSVPAEDVSVLPVLVGGVAGLALPAHRRTASADRGAAWPVLEPPVELMRLAAAARARGWEAVLDLRGYSREQRPLHWWARLLARTGEGLRHINLQFDLHDDTYRYNPDESWSADVVVEPRRGIYGFTPVEPGRLVHDRPPVGDSDRSSRRGLDLDDIAAEIWESGHTNLHHRHAPDIEAEVPHVSAEQRLALRDVLTAHILSDTELLLAATEQNIESATRDAVEHLLRRYAEAPAGSPPRETSAAAHDVAAELLADPARVELLTAGLVAKIEGRDPIGDREELLIAALAQGEEVAVRRGIELGLDLAAEHISVQSDSGINPVYRIESGGRAFSSTLSRARGLHSVWIADEHTRGWHLAPDEPFLGWPADTGEIMIAVRTHTQRLADRAALEARLRAERTPDPTATPSPVTPGHEAADPADRYPVPQLLDFAQKCGWSARIHHDGDSVVLRARTRIDSEQWAVTVAWPREPGENPLTPTRLSHRVGENTSDDTTDIAVLLRILASARESVDLRAHFTRAHHDLTDRITDEGNRGRPGSYRWDLARAVLGAEVLRGYAELAAGPDPTRADRSEIAHVETELAHLTTLAEARTRILAALNPAEPHTGTSATVDRALDNALDLTLHQLTHHARTRDPDQSAVMGLLRARSVLPDRLDTVLAILRATHDPTLTDTDTAPSPTEIDEPAPDLTPEAPAEEEPDDAAVDAATPPTVAPGVGAAATPPTPPTPVALSEVVGAVRGLTGYESTGPYSIDLRTHQTPLADGSTHRLRVIDPVVAGGFAGPILHYWDGHPEQIIAAAITGGYLQPTPPRPETPTAPVDPVIEEIWSLFDDTPDPEPVPSPSPATVVTAEAVEPVAVPSRPVPVATVRPRGGRSASLSEDQRLVVYSFGRSHPYLYQALTSEDPTHAIGRLFSGQPGGSLAGYVVAVRPHWNHLFYRARAGKMGLDTLGEGVLPADAAAATITKAALIRFAQSLSPETRAHLADAAPHEHDDRLRDILNLPTAPTAPAPDSPAVDRPEDDLPAAEPAITAETESPAPQPVPVDAPDSGTERQEVLSAEVRLALFTMGIDNLAVTWGPNPRQATRRMLNSTDTGGGMHRAVLERRPHWRGLYYEALNGRIRLRSMRDTLVAADAAAVVITTDTLEQFARSLDSETRARLADDTLPDNERTRLLREALGIDTITPTPPEPTPNPPAAPTPTEQTAPEDATPPDPDPSASAAVTPDIDGRTDTSGDGVVKARHPGLWAAVEAELSANAGRDSGEDGPTRAERDIAYHGAVIARITLELPLVTRVEDRAELTGQVRYARTELAAARRARAVFDAFEAELATIWPVLEPPVAEQLSDVIHTSADTDRHDRDPNPVLRQELTRLAIPGLDTDRVLDRVTTAVGEVAVPVEDTVSSSTDRGWDIPVPAGGRAGMGKAALSKMLRRVGAVCEDDRRAAALSLAATALVETGWARGGGVRVQARRLAEADQTVAAYGLTRAEADARVAAIGDLATELDRLGYGRTPVAMVKGIAPELGTYLRDYAAAYRDRRAELTPDTPPEEDTDISGRCRTEVASRLAAAARAHGYQVEAASSVTVGAGGEYRLTATDPDHPDHGFTLVWRVPAQPGRAVLLASRSSYRTPGVAQDSEAARALPARVFAALRARLAPPTADEVTAEQARARVEFTRESARLSTGLCLSVDGGAEVQLGHRRAESAWLTGELAECDDERTRTGLHRARLRVEDTIAALIMVGEAQQQVRELLESGALSFGDLDDATADELLDALYDAVTTAGHDTDAAGAWERFAARVETAALTADQQQAWLDHTRRRYRPENAAISVAAEVAERAEAAVVPPVTASVAVAAVSGSVVASPAVAVGEERFAPTAQQQVVYDHVLAGLTVKIAAGAGAGKTSTLEGLARRIALADPNARIAYLVFNRSTQEEAVGRMPGNVEPRTGHSLAYRWAPRYLQRRLDDSEAIRGPEDVARHLHLSTDGVPDPESALAALRTVDAYATSAEDEIGVRHLPAAIREMPATVGQRVIAAAERAWADLCAEDGRLRLTHDHLRKMWASTRPDLNAPGCGLRTPATVLFVDEAQDTAPVLARVVAEQRIQTVIVGDQDQAIYAFTGALDYLSTATADIELPLTKSWRFGPAVADIGNRFLELLDSPKRVEGAGPVTEITEPATMSDADAILVRTNAGAITQIARELAAGRIVGVPKGVKSELTCLVDTARYLQGRGHRPRAVHEDLAPFRSWSGAVAEADKGEDPKLAMLVGIVERQGVEELAALVRKVIESVDGVLDGVEFRDTAHGLIATGNTYPHRSLLGRAGFDRRDDPDGARHQRGPNQGRPQQVWIATGTAEQRAAVHERALAFATPDVVVTTAHKAKGLEWDHVRIADDFKVPTISPAGDLELPNPEELRLAYVAVTRARKVLDPGALSYVYDYTSLDGGTPTAATTLTPLRPTEDLAPTPAPEPAATTTEPDPATTESAPAIDIPEAGAWPADRIAALARARGWSAHSTIGDTDGLRLMLDGVIRDQRWRLVLEWARADLGVRCAPSTVSTSLGEAPPEHAVTRASTLPEVLELLGDADSAVDLVAYFARELDDLPDVAVDGDRFDHDAYDIAYWRAAALHDYARVAADPWDTDATAAAETAETELRRAHAITGARRALTALLDAGTTDLGTAIDTVVRAHAADSDDTGPLDSEFAVALARHDIPADTRRTALEIVAGIRPPERHVDDRPEDPPPVQAHSARDGFVGGAAVEAGLPSRRRPPTPKTYGVEDPGDLLRLADVAAEYGWWVSYRWRHGLDAPARRLRLFVRSVHGQPEILVVARWHLDSDGRYRFSPQDSTITGPDQHRADAVSLTEIERTLRANPQRPHYDITAETALQTDRIIDDALARANRGEFDTDPTREQILAHVEHHLAAALTDAEHARDSDTLDMVLGLHDQTAAITGRILDVLASATDTVGPAMTGAEPAHDSPVPHTEPAVVPVAAIVIVHNRTQTLVHGTTEHDVAIHAILHGAGAKFSKSIGEDGAWYLPRPWRFSTRSQRVERIVAALTAAGIPHHTQQTPYHPEPEPTTETPTLAPEPDPTRPATGDIEPARPDTTRTPGPSTTDSPTGDISTTTVDPTPARSGAGSERPAAVALGATRIAEQAGRNLWRVHEDRGESTHRVSIEASTVRGRRRYVLVWRREGAGFRFDRARSLAVHLPAGDSDRRPTLAQVRAEIAYTAIDPAATVSARLDTDTAPSTDEVTAVLGTPTTVDLPPALYAPIGVEYAAKAGVADADAGDRRALLVAHQLYSQARVSRLTAELATAPEVWPRAGDREALGREIEGVRADYAAAVRAHGELSGAQQTVMIRDFARVGGEPEADTDALPPRVQQALHAELDALAALRAAPDPDDRAALVVLQIAHVEATIARLHASASTADYTSPLASADHDIEMAAALAALGAHRAAHRVGGRARELIRNSTTLRASEANPRAVLDTIDTAVWAIADAPDQAGETRAQLELALFRLRVPDPDRDALLEHIDNYRRDRDLPATAPTTDHPPPIPAPTTEPPTTTESPTTTDTEYAADIAAEPSADQVGERTALLRDRIRQATEESTPLRYMATANTYDDYIRAAVAITTDHIVTALNEDFTRSEGHDRAVSKQALAVIAKKGELEPFARELADTVWHRTHPSTATEAQNSSTVDAVTGVRFDRQALAVVVEHAATGSVLAQMCADGDVGFCRVFAASAAHAVLDGLTEGDRDSGTGQSGVGEAARLLRERAGTEVGAILAAAVWHRVTGTVFEGDFEHGLNPAFERFTGHVEVSVDEDEPRRADYDILAARRWFTLTPPTAGSGEYSVFAHADDSEIAFGGGEQPLELSADSPTRIPIVIREFLYDEAEAEARQIAAHRPPPEAAELGEQAAARGWHREQRFQQPHPRDRRYELMLVCPDDAQHSTVFRLRFDLAGPYGPFAYNPARSSLTIDDHTRLGLTLDHVRETLGAPTTPGVASVPEATTPPTPTAATRTPPASTPRSDTGPEPRRANTTTSTPTGPAARNAGSTGANPVTEPRTVPRASDDPETVHDPETFHDVDGFVPATGAPDPALPSQDGPPRAVHTTETDETVGVAENWVHPGVVTVPSGKRSRARANMDAIELLDHLDTEDRRATADEAPVLAAWSGWGAVPEIFDVGKTDWDTDRDRLRGLLAPDAFEAAAESTLNAHYTDPAIAARMWTALVEAGFTGGPVVEPGGGAGTFVGLAPPTARMVVVENDPTSARLIHRLYPRALVRQEGFEHTHLPARSFAAAIGNVPFGKWEVRDPTYNPRGHTIHNAFILKSLAMTAPGGYVMVISSAWTMDATNDLARADMLDTADFLGAVRLPGKAFTRVAGTPVVTDIIVLRKRTPTPESGETPEPSAAVAARNEQFLTSVPREMIDTVTGENVTVSINRWFTDNPGFVLGELSAGHGQYRGGSLTVDHHDLTLLPDQVGAALGEIVTAARASGQALTARVTDLVELARPWSGLMVRDPDRTLTHPIGMLRYNSETAAFEAVTEFGTWEPVTVFANRATETRALLHLRDLTRRLVTAQREDLGTHERTQARERLNRAYDDYHARYGPINRFTWQGGRERSLDEHERRYADLEIKWRRRHAGEDGNPYVGEVPAEVAEELDDKAWTASPRWKQRTHLAGAIGADPTFAAVLALEDFDDRTGHAIKADIFTTDILTTPRVPSSTDEPAEALSISLGAGRGVDLAYIGQLLDIGEDTARERLRGLVFADPDRPGVLVPAPKYLSGDVRAKLARARLAAAADDGFAENVTALEAVQPAWREAARIKVAPGTVWIPEADHGDFARETFGLARVKVGRVGATMRFESDSATSSKERSWGTRHRSALDLLESVCNSSPIVVHHSKQEREEQGAPLINVKATAAAQAQAERIRSEFRRWIWTDEQRRERLVALFNHSFNCWVEPRHDGSALQIPGLSSAITPYKYQLDGAARASNEPTTQLDHAVGAGKTGTMLLTGWLLKRYGVINQPWIVVPDHIVEDVVVSAAQWFPTSQILSAASGLSPTERRRFVAQTATSDWDFVIVGMIIFETIGVKPARLARYIREELADLDALAATFDDETPRRSVKDHLRASKHLQLRLERLTEQSRKDPGLSIEDSGLDYLLADEFHLYKNKARYSPVAELAHSPGSRRSENISIVLKVLRERAEARALARGRVPVIDDMRIATAATGTRIANALAEEWVHQQYLRPDLLESRGIADVTPWGTLFTATKSVITTNASGTSVRAVEKIARYANLAQMLALTGVYTDIVTRDQVPAKLPTLRGGKRLVVSIEPGQDAIDFIADLDYRMAMLDPDDTAYDNVLKILSDGRNLALDPTLVGLEPDLARSRVFLVAREMLTRYHATKTRRYLAPNGEPHPVPGALQIGFCDRGTPTGVNKHHSFYTTLKSLLVDGLPELGLTGIPAEKIAFIHDARKPSEKRQLVDDCRNGHIAVLLGSTDKMGTGMNVQTRAVALHHIDVPWRPDQLEQREGRIIRQHNQNDEVDILCYAIERTIDTFMWSVVENKALFIEQARTGNLDTDEVDIIDEDDIAVAAAMTKAAATGDPRHMRMAELDQQVRHLSALDDAHNEARSRAQSQIRVLPNQIDHLEHLITTATTHLNATAAWATNPGILVVAGQHFTDRGKANKALLQATRAAFLRADAAVKNHQPQPTTPQPIATIDGHTITASLQWGTLHLHIGDLPVSTSIDRTQLFPAATNDPNQSTPPQPNGDAAIARGLTTRITNAYTGLDTKLLHLRADIEDKKADLEYSRGVVDAPFDHADALVAGKVELTQIRLALDEARNSPEALAEALARDERLRAAGRDPGWSLHLNPTTATVIKSDFATRAQYVAAVKTMMDENAARYAADDTDDASIDDASPPPGTTPTDGATAAPSTSPSAAAASAPRRRIHPPPPTSHSHRI